MKGRSLAMNPHMTIDQPFVFTIMKHVTEKVEKKNQMLPPFIPIFQGKCNDPTKKTSEQKKESK